MLRKTFGYISYLLFFIIFPINTFCQTVRISVFNEFPVKSVIVSSINGKFNVLDENNQLVEDLTNGAIYISFYDNKLLLHDSEKPMGVFTSIRFKATDSASILKITPIDPKVEPRQYEDNLEVSVAFNRILLCNQIQEDKYISGVVEAEGGPKAAKEFYKAQSILVRTYLYGHINRHESEGFNLCDGVHCQAYHGRPMLDPMIRDQTMATSGIVALDSDSDYITAVFHANCGGETESAGNTWIHGKNYLIPVKDPFCKNSPSYRWTRSIQINQWITYLKSKGFNLPQSNLPNEFDFIQVGRKPYYKIGNDSIPIKQIRGDFQLRSSFFSVYTQNDHILLDGKGFGHGVGLCQDGAMQMAKLGYKYDEILKFYYKNISIVRRQL
jgi:stage II sporulation protein D